MRRSNASPNRGGAQASKRRRHPPAQVTTRRASLDIATADDESIDSVPTLETNDGVDLYYERHGDDGDAVVLVHGFTGDTTDWRHQVAALAASHRLLVLDHRGHGRSSPPAEEAAYSIERMADDVEALASAVGFERYHLVGHSMGGAIAQEIALRSGARLLSLTLEDTSFSFAEFEPRMPDKPPPLPPERLEEVLARLARMPQHVLRFCWRALRRWPGTGTSAGAIATPTLIVCGADDAPTLVRGSRRLAELIPGSRLETIVGAAHSPQEEQPESFNALWRDFVLTAGSRDASRCVER
jgi:pimeloyl-ACP methyl ester carboxylesterase